MQPDPSPLEAALLGLLARGPASGYELRKVFQTTPLAAYSDSPGAVYPALRRLEQRGYVTGGDATGARRRRVLRLSAAGRAWIRNWIGRPVTVHDVTHDPSLVDLRLALISDVTPVRLPTFLQEYADAVDVHLAELTTAAAALEPELSPSAASALDLGIHVIRARKAWCRRAARTHAL